MHRSDRDFQKFYMTKVGLGEGCGCAERVIDLHETSRRAATPLKRPYRDKAHAPRGWRRLFQALGLVRKA